MKRSFLVALLLPVLAACSSDHDPQASAAPSTSVAVGVVVDRGVEYGTAEMGSAGERAPLLMDVYRPGGTGRRRPVVVLVHGGGFTQLSRTDNVIVKIAEALAERGIVAVSIDYRLIPQVPVPSPRVQPLLDALPDGDESTAMASAVDDTLTALDHLAEHADELGIDMRRLGLVGGSAGAMTVDHVAYVLDDHGIDGPAITFVASLWGGIFVGAADQLDAGEAALFAVHGDADEQVPVQRSDELVARAEAEGVATEYHRLPGAGHGFYPSGFLLTPVDGGGTSFDRLLDFAEAQLSPQRP
ncbi:MAG: hypothetical protein JWN29_1364 [Acidimicrobiales bacterium]|nr:hypothetical protein [Acidimicrobiales bacterium]